MTYNTTLVNVKEFFPNVNTENMYSMGNARTPCLYFPRNISVMWNHCLHVGKCTVDKYNYDLGFCIDKSGNISAVIVYGEWWADYLSGNVSGQGRVYKELYKKMLECGFTEDQLNRSAK